MQTDVLIASRVKYPVREFSQSEQFSSLG